MTGVQQAPKERLDGSHCRPRHDIDQPDDDIGLAGLKARPAALAMPGDGVNKHGVRLLMRESCARLHFLD